MSDLLRRAGSLILFLAAMLSLGQAALAQGNVSVKIDRVDITQFPTVTAHALVLDENGLPIPGLAADRFELVEDGKTSFPPDEARMITNAEAPVSVLILLDLSGSMSGSPLQAAKGAITTFLERLLDEAGDPDQAAFIGFGQQVDVKALNLDNQAREVPFVNDRGRLLNTVNFVEVEGQTGTPLYDAIYRAVKIAAQQSGRRAIVVMTDGRDVGSTLKDGDPIAEAQRQHIPIFPVGLSNNRLDQSYLRRLAELTGGQYQEALTPEELGQKFQEVLSQIKIQYVLTYRSRLPNLDGQYHSLLLRVQTTRGQGFDEVKFQLGQGPVVAPTAAEPGGVAQVGMPQPVETSPSPSGVASTGGKGMLDFLSTNILLIIIAGGAFLLLVLLVLFVVLLVRRRAAPAEATWEGGSYGLAEPAWPAATPAPGPAISSRSASPGPVSSMPDASATSAPTGAGTQKAPSPFDLPPRPGPFDVPSRAAGSETPAEGGTVLIPRGAKPRVLGLLMDRKQPSRRYDVDRPVVTIGRGADNVIVLDHPKVSRQHAVIKVEGDEFYLYDLGSANGTFVGDTQVREPVTLQDGARVRFGEMDFMFKRIALE